MELGKKLKDAMTIIKWANSMGINEVLIPFDAELEVQLWTLGFNCKTLYNYDSKYLTRVT